MRTRTGHDAQRGHRGSAALVAAASLVLTAPIYAIDTNFEYQLNPQHNFGKCLDVQGGSMADSAHVIQYTCLDQPNQRFRFVHIGANFYEIRAVHSDKCLDIQGGSTANSAHLIQYTCLGGPNQRFWLEDDTPLAGFTSRLIAGHSSKCLDVQGGSDANSAHVIQYTCHDGPNQLFDGVATD